MPWDPKDPMDSLNYSVDYTLELRGDTIVSSAWTVPAGLVKIGESRTDTIATIQLSGGEADMTYAVENRITTAAGRSYKRTGQLSVREM